MAQGLPIHCHRHEKLAVNFAAMVKLAFLRQYLRVLEPLDRT